MKPLLEKATVPEGASWTMYERRLEDGIPFQWHCHPEFELTLTLNSSGQRFVGDHIGSYVDGDLVLLGTNLPHTWASSRKTRDDEAAVAVVLWFRPEWLAALIETLPELLPLDHMFKTAARGLAFSPAAAATAAPIIGRMLAADPAHRILRLLDLFVLLSQDREAMPLASPTHGAATTDPLDRPRIELVLAHIHAHYREDISATTLAGLACRSVSRFHHLFRRHTRTTVIDYVSQLRIGQACSMLAAGDLPVAHIAEAVGYGNLSHFNRKFRELKKRTPREYRAEFRKNAR